MSQKDIEKSTGFYRIIMFRYGRKIATKLAFHFLWFDNKNAMQVWNYQTVYSSVKVLLIVIKIDFKFMLLTLEHQNDLYSQA